MAVEPLQGSRGGSRQSTFEGTPMFGEWDGVIVTSASAAGPGVAAFCSTVGLPTEGGAMFAPCVVAVVVVSLSLVPGPSRIVEARSDGCDSLVGLSDEFMDRQSSSQSFGPATFDAGETLLISADRAGEAVGIRLLNGDDVLATATFPNATVRYVIPVTGQYDLRWDTNYAGEDSGPGSEVIWRRVDCVRAPTADDWVDVAIRKWVFPAESGEQSVCETDPCEGGESLTRARGDELVYSLFTTVAGESGLGLYGLLEPKVVVIDPLPNGVSFVSAEVDEGDAEGSCSEDGGVVTCVFDISAGDVEVYIYAAIDTDVAGGVLTNTATASGVSSLSGKVADPDLTNNTSVADVIVAESVATTNPPTTSGGGSLPDTGTSATTNAPTTSGGGSLPETGTSATTSGALTIAISCVTIGIAILAAVRRSRSSTTRS